MEKKQEGWRGRVRRWVARNLFQCFYVRPSCFIYVHGCIQ